MQRIQIAEVDGGFSVAIVENRHGGDRADNFKDLKSALDYINFVISKQPQKQDLEDYLDPVGAKKRKDARDAAAKALAASGKK